MKLYVSYQIIEAYKDKFWLVHRSQ